MKATRQNPAPSVARRIRDNLALLRRWIRITWCGENYPAWKMYTPNPLPPGEPPRKPQTLLWCRIRSTWWSEKYPAWMIYLPNPLTPGRKPIRPQ
jgi:hypothetical protein